MNRPELADDPDRQHLIHLLSLLPGPNDVAFWNTVSRDGRRKEMENEETKPAGDSYLLGKMEAAITHLIRCGNVEYGCRYLLKFFDGDRPQLWRFLNERLDAGGFSDHLGERWTRDLCDTAWRLLVRYGSPGSDALAEQWLSRDTRY